MIFHALEQEFSIFLFFVNLLLGHDFWPKIDAKTVPILAPFWLHFGLKSVASDQKSSTCIFKGRNSENANTSALSSLRRSIFMHFPIFLSSHLMQHSMLFLAFPAWDAIKPTNCVIVVQVYDFPCSRAKIFTFFHHFLFTSIPDMLFRRKSMPERSQNKTEMRPKWLTNLFLGALGPPLLHQGLSKGRRRSKIDRSGPKIDRNYIQSASHNPPGQCS